VVTLGSHVHTETSLGSWGQGLVWCTLWLAIHPKGCEYIFYWKNPLPLLAFLSSIIYKFNQHAISLLLPHPTQQTPPAHIHPTQCCDQNSIFNLIFYILHIQYSHAALLRGPWWGTQKPGVDSSKNQHRWLEFGGLVVYWAWAAFVCSRSTCC